MNNKTKQLAEEAGFMLWGEETWNPGDVIDWSARYDTELERFAELIVKECANLFPLTFTDEQYQRRIDKTILKHFGIHND